MKKIISAIFATLLALQISPALTQGTSQTLQQFKPYSTSNATVRAPYVAPGDLIYCGQGQATRNCTIEQLLSSLGQVTTTQPLTANRVFASPNGSVGPPTFRTMVGADLPLPTPSALGGVLSSSAGTNQVVVGLDTSGNLTYGSPTGGSLTLHGVVLGNGASPVTATAAGTNGQVLIGVTGGSPAFQTVTGDITITAGGVSSVVSISALNSLSSKVIVMPGASSGSVTITPQVAAGTPSFTYGTVSGTIVASASSPLAVDTATGVVSCATCLTSTANPPTPAGRLTLTTGTPVMTADVTAATTLYYDVFNGNGVPIYSGSTWSILTIAANEISMALDNNSGHTGYQQSGKLFDIFGYSASGTLTLCTGPAWTNTTTRSSAVSLKDGIYTNSGTMTCRFGSVSGNTVSLAANTGTLLGTMYATADGQTTMQFKPAAAAGGSNAFLGLGNVYNAEPTQSRSFDSTTSWTYNSVTWRVANAGATGSGLNNRVSWVDPIGRNRVVARYVVEAQPNTGAGGNVQIGVNFDATTGAPTGAAGQVISGLGNTTQMEIMMVSEDSMVSMGFHFAQAMEQVPSANTSTLIGNQNTAQIQALTVNLKM